MTICRTPPFLKGGRGDFSFSGTGQIYELREYLISLFKKRGVWACDPVPLFHNVESTSLGLGEGIPLLLPGGYPAQEGLGVLVASGQQLPCRTGRGMLVASGAVKDDLLILGQAVEPGLKLLESKRAFELHTAASDLIGIGAHQERLA